MYLINELTQKVRYYSIRIYPTLFGDYLIEKEYGAVSDKNPTKISKIYTDTKKDALKLMLDMAVTQKKRGYLRA